MLNNILAGVTNQSWFIIIALVLIFGVIVIAVILVRKYSKHFKSDEKPKSDREIAEEEVNRILVDVEDEETKKEMEEASKEAYKASKEEKPSAVEALQEEMSRTVEPIGDEQAALAMEEYRKAHPEEERDALKGSEKEGE